MPVKVLTILTILAVLLWSVAYLEVTGERNATSVINGFFPFDYIYNTNNVNFSGDEIAIESFNSTSKVQVYSVNNDFTWSFSATPIVAIGEHCHPIKIQIDWKGEFTDNWTKEESDIEGFLRLWAQWENSSSEWIYDYSPKPNNERSMVYPLNWLSKPVISLNCTYYINLEFITSPEYVIKFTISNSTWSGQGVAPIRIPYGTDFNLDEIDISIQAFSLGNANQPYSKAVYNNSQLTLNNSEEQNPLSIWLLFISSIVTTIITAIAIIVKSIFSSVPRSFFQRLRNLCVSLNNRKIKVFPKISAESTRIVVILLAFFAGLRLFLAFTTSGNFFDSTVLNIWSGLIKANGVLSIYNLSAALPPFLGLSPGFPYPPMIAYILNIFPHLSLQQNLLEFALKIPPIIGDLLLGLVVFIAVKSRDGLSAAVPALFLSLLNFVDSSIWGQYDSIVALFMVLAVWLVATKKIELGWLFAALAISTKQTALVFLPGLLLLNIKQKSWSRLIYGLIVFFAVTYFVWFPFLANGLSFDFSLSTTGLGFWSPNGSVHLASPSGGRTSIWAFNIWPLQTFGTDHWQNGLIGAVHDVGANAQFFSLSYMQLGLILFLIAYFFTTIRIWRSSKPIDQMLNFGLLMFAFFMLPTRIHERYLVFALSFLPFAYKRSKLILGSYLVLLSTFWLNLEYALLAGVPYGKSPFSFNIYEEIGVLVIILINIVVFLLLFIKSSNIHKT